MTNAWVTWLADFWHARQRKIDLQFLWPSCRDLAPDLNHARMAFAVHAHNDKAWLALGEAEIERIISELT
jgi:hypothetical protein